MDMHLLQKWLEAGDTTISNHLLAHYRQLGLTSDQLVLILQLKSYMDKGNDFPDTVEIAERMQAPAATIFHEIHDLIQKKFLFIKTEKNTEGKTKDQYSLELLWEKLAVCVLQNGSKEESVQQEFSEKELYGKFESEFGRSLSPIEMQTIGMWIDEDHYSMEMIEMALREAVLSQVYSLKYVDRILLNWERKNIRSKQQIERESNRHRQNKVNQTAQNDDRKAETKVPLHNWLKNTQE